MRRNNRGLRKYRSMSTATEGVRINTIESRQQLEIDNNALLFKILMGEVACTRRAPLANRKHETDAK